MITRADNPTRRAVIDAIVVTPPDGLHAAGVRAPFGRPLAVTPHQRRSFRFDLPVDSCGERHIYVVIWPPVAG